MHTMKLDTGDTPPREAEADQQRHFAWEAAKIAEADADIAAGRLVDEAEVDAWIDSVGTEHELAVPISGR
jgi:predicted transcriptional regulator